MKIDVIKVGCFNTKDVISYNIRNSKGFGINVLNYGGTITDILVPDKDGVIENIITKYKNINTYEKNPSYFGALIGRTSGRICKGEVDLEGETLKLNKNYGLHQGHGGVEGFSKKFFNVSTEIKNNEALVQLSYHSPDKEEGYPGNLDVTVIYSVTEDDELKIKYKGISDKTTLLNLTNHSYFNLGGKDEDTVLNHYLYINSSHILELDETSVPTGDRFFFSGTAFDFSNIKAIGKDIEDKQPQLLLAEGYDHPWILFDNDEVKVRLYNEKSGRVMDIYTNQSSVVLYTMNFPDDEILESGKKAGRRGAIAIETQSPPIGRNNCFSEESILEAGKEYNKETIYKFYIK